MESFEREFENGWLNYFIKDVNLVNEFIKDKFNLLYGGSEVFGISEFMIDVF